MLSDMPSSKVVKRRAEEVFANNENISETPKTDGIGPASPDISMYHCRLPIYAYVNYNDL